MALVVQVEHVPQSHVAEKTVEILQLDVVEKIVETPEIQTGHGTQDRIQQRNMEQIVDTPVLPVVEELAEASKAFTQNRSGTDCRTGSSVREEDRRGVRPATGAWRARLAHRGMGAGGSHPQATMMPDPWATYKRPSASQAKVGSPLRGGGPRSTTRAQESVSLIDETLNFFVKTSGKDEASMRQQLTSQKREELRRSRDHWKARAEEEERFQKMKEEAWRQGGVRGGTHP